MLHTCNVCNMYVTTCNVCCTRAYINIRTHTRKHTHARTKNPSGFILFRIHFVFPVHPLSVPGACYRAQKLYIQVHIVLTCRIYILCRQLTRGGFVWASCLPRKAYVSPLSFFIFLKKITLEKTKKTRGGWYGRLAGFSCMLLRQYLYFCTSKALNLCRSNHTTVSASSL
jgi:hypothetical protein